MRILKFFMLLLVLMIGGVKSAWAGDVKRNVTSSYLKNTSFEDATDFNYWTNDGLTIKNDNGKFLGISQKNMDMTKLNLDQLSKKH